MAGLPAVTLAVLVIDTSYLLELYRVPDFFDADCADEIKTRFFEAISRRSRLYVPFPVVFEVANHIVDVRDGTIRRRLAERFAADVRSSVESEAPWIIIPADKGDVMLGLAEFLDLCHRYATEFAPQQVGLTDTSLIVEAARLKRERYAHASQKVHIWTKDKRLKAHEPDTEPDPYLG